MKVKVGDLIRFKAVNRPYAGKFYLVTRISNGFISLCGFSSNAVFREDQVEIISESR